MRNITWPISDVSKESFVVPKVPPKWVDWSYIYYLYITLHCTSIKSTCNMCNITWPTSNITKDSLCTLFVFPNMSQRWVDWSHIYYLCTTLHCTSIKSTCNIMCNITWPTSDVTKESLCALFGVPKVIPQSGLNDPSNTTYTPLCTPHRLQAFLLA